LKFLTYALVAGAAFWVGVASSVNPIIQPTRIIVQPANNTIWKHESCTELARACYARKRAERIKS
jgi:hypothetical protein